MSAIPRLRPRLLWLWALLPLALALGCFAVAIDGASNAGTVLYRGPLLTDWQDHAPTLDEFAAADRPILERTRNDPDRTPGIQASIEADYRASAVRNRERSIAEHDAAEADYASAKLYGFLFGAVLLLAAPAFPWAMRRLMPRIIRAPGWLAAHRPAFAPKAPRDPSIPVAVLVDERTGFKTTRGIAHAFLWGGLIGVVLGVWIVATAAPGIAPILGLFLVLAGLMSAGMSARQVRRIAKHQREIDRDFARQKLADAAFAQQAATGSMALQSGLVTGKPISNGTGTPQAAAPNDDGFRIDMPQGEAS